jgi:hypothetical protein
VSPFYFSRAVLLALATPFIAYAQQPPAPPPLQEAGAASFTIFVRGMPVGTEQIALIRGAEGWTIVSSGRLGAPLDIVARRIEVRYTADWRPIHFALEHDLCRRPGG